MNRGAELLRRWRGKRKQEVVIAILGLDPATYSRFENGVRRPDAERCFEIAKITRGKVPAKTWFDPPRITAVSKAV